LTKITHLHSCQTYKRGNGEEKRGKKGAFFHKKRGNKGAKKRGNALRAAVSDEQFIFFFFHISNAENINYIEGTAQGFFTLILKNFTKKSGSG